MILSSVLKLEALLAANVSTAQPQVHVDYIDYGADGNPTVPAPARTTLNNSTAVTILASPTGGNKVREPIGLTFYNADSAAVTSIIRSNDGTSTYIIMKQGLAVGETLVYEKKSGWQIL